MTSGDSVRGDNLRGALWMNLSMAAFTLNDAMMKWLGQSLPLFQSILLRGAMTVPLLLALALATGGLGLATLGVDRRVMVLRALAEVGATLFFLTALMHVPLANLTAVMQSTPLVITLVGALFLGERVGWRRSIAILAGFVGVLLVIRPTGEGFSIWVLSGVVAVGFVVMRDLVTRRLSGTARSPTVALVTAIAVTTMGGIGTVFTGWQPVAAPQLGLALGAALAVVTGYVTVVKAMRVGDIGFVSPFRYSALLWAIMLGWTVFDAFPDALTFLGAGVIVASGVFTLIRGRRVTGG